MDGCGDAFRCLVNGYLFCAPGTPDPTPGLGSEVVVIFQLAICARHTYECNSCSLGRRALPCTLTVGWLRTRSAPLLE
eukprot:192491-Chlamydomonas_euryale.AAC.4